MLTNMTDILSIKPFIKYCEYGSHRVYKLIQWVPSNSMRVYSWMYSKFLSDCQVTSRSWNWKQPRGLKHHLVNLLPQ